MVWLLAAAAAAALATGDRAEAAAILAVLAVNALLGFVTELRARRTMEGLLRLEVRRAVVVREGRRADVDAAGLVPGDVIEVESGMAVPADARLLSAAGLRAAEAPLTGEAFPVDKTAGALLTADTPLPERTNMLYRSTAVVGGTGRAVVVATGAATEVGRIGRLVEAIPDERTPLERQLDALGRRLVWAALAVAAVVAGLGLLQGMDVARMVQTGLALAVAAVPEGLPTVATVAMAVGLRRMAKRNALVRRLPAVESLGAATVVCTDKTGTLTAGRMQVAAVWTEDGEAEASRIGETLSVAALAGRPHSADPTEIALVEAVRAAGLEPGELERQRPEVAELPFSSETMLTASFRRGVEGVVETYVKGAPDRVLQRCALLAGRAGALAPLDDAARRRLLEANETLAARGLRVLALARSPRAGEGGVSGPSPVGSGGTDGAGVAIHPDAGGLAGLVFVGLVGLVDPPAEGVEETLTTLRQAGVRTVMLTGDQRITARAIARRLGILPPGGEVLDARDLAALGDAELAARLAGIAGFSRVSPADKLRIVAAFQARGEVVAMLGDGVNDAAALRKADVGVAMGRRGSDAAVEVADVVLRDDRFPTLAAAVEEGRILADNVRRFVFYLFGCNLAEVLVLLGAGLAGLPLPLLPLQILWLNLVTDTFPALALAFEGPDPDVMRRPPRDPRRGLVSGRFLRSVAFYAALITAATLAAFVLALRETPGDPARAVTAGFLTLGFAQILHLGTARSRSAVLAPAAALRNPFAIAGAALAVALQLAAVYAPPLRALLGTVPPSGAGWAAIAALSALPALAGQGLRLARDRRAAAGRPGAA